MHEPTGHQGPFVEPPRGGGLLRRLLRSGGGEHPQDATSVEPERPAPGTARSMPRVDHTVPTSTPSGAQRGVLAIVLGWLWARLKWRLIFTSLLLVGVLVVMQVDRDLPGTNGIPRFSTPTVTPYEPAPGNAAPDSKVPSGVEIVTVDRIRGTRVTTTDILSRTYTWYATDPAIRRQLVAAGDKRLIVSWERNAAGNVVITRVLVTQTAPPTT